MESTWTVLNSVIAKPLLSVSYRPGTKVTDTLLLGTRVYPDSQDCVLIGFSQKKSATLLVVLMCPDEV